MVPCNIPWYKLSVPWMDGWMDGWCFRPLFCTIKAELGRGQPGLMRWSWDETLPQCSIDRSTFYTAAHRATSELAAAPYLYHGESKLFHMLANGCTVVRIQYNFLYHACTMVTQGCTMVHLPCAMVLFQKGYPTLHSHGTTCYASHHYVSRVISTDGIGVTLTSPRITKL